MTDTTQAPNGGGSPDQQARTAQPKPRTSPTGFGRGPFIASGVIVGGALLFAGWGIGHMATSEGGIVAAMAGEPSSAESPVDDDGGSTRGEDGGTVTLPDSDGDGVPDGFTRDEDETGEGDEGEGPSGLDDETGRGDEDEASRSDDSEPDRPQTWTYVIQPGDTLTEISGETGVPVGVLVEKNKIQNPNLIYAGASLLIPPMG